MPKYLFEATYVGKGIQGLMQEGGTRRREALTEALKSVGGSLESFYYAFGYYDVLGVFEAPDDASAAALSLLINSTGNVVRLKRLLTVEDLDEAAKKTPVREPAASCPDLICVRGPGRWSVERLCCSGPETRY